MIVNISYEKVGIVQTNHLKLSLIKYRKAGQPSYKLTNNVKVTQLNRQR